MKFDSEKVFMRKLSGPVLLMIFAPAILLSGPPMEPRAPAGIIERQIQEEYDEKPLMPDKEIPLLEVDIPKDHLDLPDGQTVAISQVVFSGNTVIGTQILEEIAIGDCNRDLCMKDISSLCMAIQNEYRRRGYFLARAFPPPQEIHNGVLLIQVIEGSLGQLTVEGNTHYSTAFIESYFSDLVGAPLNYNLFLKRMLLLNENPELKASAVFKKGSRTGTADLIIRVEDHRPISFYVDYNNYGSSYTTRSRVGAKLNVGNIPIGASRFSLTQVQGLPFDELLFTQATYRIPLVNRTGAALEGAYLYSRFHVPPFSDLDVKGGTNIGTIRYIQPVGRTRALHADIYTSFDFKDIRNFLLDTAASIDILRELGAGFDLDYIDPWGRTFFESYIYFGIPDIFGGSPSTNPMSSHPGAGARFIKGTGYIKRLQKIVSDYYLMVSLTGQWSTRRLPIAEEIYIGGVDTVRGFFPAVALGDQGLYVNCELRIPPPFFADTHVFKFKKTWREILQIVAFIDCGSVFFMQDSGTVQTTLTGVGLGGRLFGFWDFNASIDVGFPVQSDISPTSTVTYARVSWDHKF